MPPSASSKCPACGVESTGKFCNSCGAPLTGPATCEKCGAALSARAKFCPGCGAPTGSRAAGHPGERTPWVVAGVAVAVAVVAVVAVFARSGAPAPPAEDAAAAAGAGQATDLTQMTPRQAADRLFDRVMLASESGDTAQVAQFGPMAIQAHNVLEGGLDPDARLHVGLISLAMGNAAGAAAQADTVLRGSPTHLYGLVLRARAAALAGDAAGRRRALEAFLRSYAAERARNLPEYAQHARLLSDTRDLAERTAGAAAPR